MNRISLLIFLSACLLALSTGCGSNKGGLDKAEYKKWRDKAKQYKKNPAALKAKEEGCQKEIADLTQQNSDLNKRIKELERELQDCVNKYEELLRQKDARFDSLVYEFKKLQTGYEAVKNVTTPTDGSEVVNNTGSGPDTGRETGGNQRYDDGMRGVIFRVQIGAYQKFKIDDKMANTEKNFSGESLDGMNKYLIGRFRNYELAQQFRKDIVKLGIRDAWVVAYSDGVRVTINEAISKQKGG